MTSPQTKREGWSFFLGLSERRIKTGYYFGDLRDFNLSCKNKNFLKILSKDSVGIMYIMISDELLSKPLKKRVQINSCFITRSS